MLSGLFESAARMGSLRASPAGTSLESFADALFLAGYARVSARRQIRGAEHFAWWADRHGLWVSGITEQVVGRFARHLSRCRCRGYGHSDRSLLHGVRLFLRHLEETRVISMPATARLSSDPALLVAFRDWMRGQRSACDGTMEGYAPHIRELLARLEEAPGGLDASTLRQCVLDGSREFGWASAKKRTTALRMFVRFLIAEGRCTSGLENAVPTLAHWRLASLPRYFSEADVERLMASCDLTSPVGRRDRAILLLLARLGLRAGDIVQLRLSDIDWKDASIRVCGKGHREARLPLTQEVGQALVAYLRTARPRTDSDTVFVRCRAPFLAFRSHCAVSVIVDRALHRAHVKRPCRGAAHLLRHSVAASMLRHGASLQEVAALLRHRSIATTQIYAQVDVHALRTIAQPWPEVRSC